MHPASHSAAVRAAELLLRRWIGLDIETIGWAALERAVRNRMDAADVLDPAAFAGLLGAEAAERDALVEEIVVAESWFFRDPQVFDVVKQVAATRTVLPNRGPLRVLCVPCAAGEEPYSVAMTLLDAGLPNSSFAIDAVDVSRAGLARAAAATYVPNAFRNADLGFRDRWFHQDGSVARLHDAVRNAVNFSWGNILDETFAAGRDAYDVVFCRNLLIYLTAEARTRVERVLDLLLKPDGILVLGAAEPPILRGAWIPATERASFALRRSPQAGKTPPPSAARGVPRPAVIGQASGLPGRHPVDASSRQPVPVPAAPSAHDAAASMPDCWRTIGVSGDRSCPELERFIHCRNCPVLADAARAFFDRPAPDGYLDSWREVLERPEKEAGAETTSVLVFRIGPEWLALPASALVEIAPTRRLHRLPHLRGRILEGVVNIRGQLQLCASLAGLLGIDRQPMLADAGTAARFLVVDRNGDRWVFEVDEVAGVHRVPQADLRPVPSTVSAAARQAAVALFAAHDRTVGLLDETRLLETLRERILE